MKVGFVFYNLGIMLVVMALLVGGAANQEMSDWMRIAMLLVGGLILVAAGFELGFHYDGGSLAPH